MLRDILRPDHSLWDFTTTSNDDRTMRQGRLTWQRTARMGSKPASLESLSPTVEAYLLPTITSFQLSSLLILSYSPTYFYVVFPIS